MRIEAEVKGIIEEAGGVYAGRRMFEKGIMIFFHDPATRNTLAIYEHDLSPLAVETKIKESREAFEKRDHGLDDQAAGFVVAYDAAHEIREAHRI